MIRLESWRYVGHRLAGVVFGHPYHADGKEVMVSAPVSFDEEAMTVRTLNSTYELGECAGNLAEQMNYIRSDIEASCNYLKNGY